jgi:hypothetical protein
MGRYRSGTKSGSSTDATTPLAAALVRTDSQKAVGNPIQSGPHQEGRR